MIYSSEMTDIMLFWSSRLVLNRIDGKRNKLSWKILRGEGQTQVGKVALFLDTIYGYE